MVSLPRPLQLAAGAPTFSAVVGRAWHSLHEVEPAARRSSRPDHSHHPHPPPWDPCWSACSGGVAPRGCDTAPAVGAGASLGHVTRGQVPRAQAREEAGAAEAAGRLADVAFPGRAGGAGGQEWAEPAVVAGAGGRGAAGPWSHCC